MSYDKKKKRKATHKLENLDVREVSLVSRPAIGRKYLLMKSADSVVPDNPSEELIVHAEDQTKTDAGTSPADLGVANMNEKLLELLKSAEIEDEALAGALNSILEAEVPEEVMKSFYELAGFEIPKEEVIVEKEVEKIVEVEVEKPDTTDETEVLKGLNPEQEAIFKEMQGKLEVMQKGLTEQAMKAEEERQERVTKEFVTKAAKEYDRLPFSADDLGPVLKSVTEKLDEAESKTVLEIFNAANEAIEKSDQLVEKGTPGEADGTKTTGEAAWVTEAKKMFDEGKADTFEQAVSKLADENPNIFSEDN
jgi:hypothetical protein